MNICMSSKLFVVLFLTMAGVAALLGAPGDEGLFLRQPTGTYYDQNGKETIQPKIGR